jgi:hypothetical protein
MTTALILSPSPDLVPARLFAPTPKAAQGVVEFFTEQINNDHTRKAHLKNGGTLKHAQQSANHASPRTTKLYDRRSNEISLDEVEKISI